MDEQGASFLTASTQSRVPIYTGKGDLVDWNKRKLPSKTVRTITWHHRTYMTFLQSPTAPPVSLPPSFTGHLNLHPPLRIPPRLHHPVHYNPHLLLLPFPPSHPTHPVPSPFSARFLTCPSPATLHQHTQPLLHTTPIRIAPNYLHVLANNLEVFKRINTTRPTHDRNSWRTQDTTR